MKIESINTYVEDAGWRPWQFTEIITDSGITGYGEMSDGRNPWGIVGTVEDFKPLLIGRDPLNIQAIYWDLQRMAIQSKGGIALKAIAGIELALWDIKGKHHGVPVYDLFGWKVRNKQKIYCSHCGTSRARSFEQLGVAPLNSRKDIINLGKEVMNKGYTSLKTNIIVRPDSPLSNTPESTYVFFGGFGGGFGTTDQGLEYTSEGQTIINYELPGDLKSAIELSKKNNPDLIIAKLEYEQSIKDKSIAKSDLAPTAKLSFERSYTEDLNTTYDEREKDTVKATVSWPFFSGGKNIAKYKKNQSLENRKRLILDSAVKQNQTDVASAWSNYQSNRSLLNSVQSQVKAAEIANEGIAAEYNSGAGRTTLEVIQSNSLLLNAQISLADSERNYILSQFNLLKSLGLLNSDYLKIR